jgi:hypothetical protein
MISFVIPSKFISPVKSGKLVRYGCIIKDAHTGQIVGHLKEVGNLSNTLSNIIPANPLNPLNSVTSIISNIQLYNIEKTLSSLKLISTVGAISSIATLGVSIVGFFIVNKKLDKIEKKLDVIIKQNDKIIKLLEKHHLEKQMLHFAEIKMASELLEDAQETNDIDRRKELLFASNEIFRKYNNFYQQLVSNNIWYDNQISLEESYALYNRYIFCVNGELHSEFLLGDLKVFYKSWERNNNKVRAMNNFDLKKAFRVRSDNDISLFNTLNYDDLIDKIKNIKSIIHETSKRIETLNIEAKYLEKSGIEPIEYIKFLRKQKDNIVLIPKI